MRGIAMGALVALLLGCDTSPSEQPQSPQATPSSQEKPPASSTDEPGPVVDGSKVDSSEAGPSRRPLAPSRRLDCGDVRPWDQDGDGLSDTVESNNAGEGFHDFRSDRCEDDPSRAVGTWYEGHLEGGINLNDRGNGFVHHRGTDSVDSDDWADLTMIRCLEAVGRAFEDTGLRLNVNDLARRQGRHFAPHRSHQNGLDADLRYVRRDGKDAPLDLRFHPEAYDLEATQEVMRLLVEHCPVEVIFVDLERLGFDNGSLGQRHQVLRHASGHSNHFHLRLREAP